VTATLIRDAMVWDATDASAFPGEILIEGNRIRAVARGHDQIDRTRAASMIDAQGLFLMPGMVEGHCHMSFVDVSQNKELGEIPVEEHLLRTCRNATKLLDHGFTSCYSAASAKLRLDVVVRDEIENGYLAGPRYRAAGPEITVTGGLGDENRQGITASSFGMVADGADAIRHAVRLCIREGVDNVKINISGDEFTSNVRAEAVSMTEGEVAAAVEVAHEWGKRVSCHSRAAAAVKRAVRNGVDCIYHCDFADDEAIEMLIAARDRIFVGPAFGLVHNGVFEHDRIGMSAATVARMGLARKLEATCRVYERLREAGVRVVIGGDYGFTLTPMGQNARDIGHFVKFFGYSPAAALRCATAVGGELMGHGGELGLVREGALADLLLVDGDPLRDPSVLVGPDRLAMVMKDGRMHRDPRDRPAAERRVAAE